MTFEEFLADDRVTNFWVREPGFEYYVRKNLLYRGAIDLANIEAIRDGTVAGWWKFLRRWEKRLPLRAENILNPDMANYFRRRGWHETRDLAGLPTFYSPLFVERFGERDDHSNRAVR